MSLNFLFFILHLGTFDPFINVCFKCHAAMDNKWKICRTKLVTLKCNQAPYHVISQCFYVYVLLEGGHRMKTIPNRKLKFHLFTCSFLRLLLICEIVSWKTWSVNAKCRALFNLADKWANLEHRTCGYDI